jgi:hypothetical protein
MLYDQKREHASITLVTFANMKLIPNGKKVKIKEIILGSRIKQ